MCKDKELLWLKIVSFKRDVVNWKRNPSVQLKSYFSASASQYLIFNCISKKIAINIQSVY